MVKNMTITIMNLITRWVTNWGKTMNDDLKDIKGATVFYMEPDGRTTKDVYSDEAFENPLPNPIQAIDGELPEMYFKDGAASYCILVQDNTGKTVSRKEAGSVVENTEITEVPAEESPIEELI